MIVGEIASAGAVEIYVLELDGFTVAHTERFHVGTGTFAGVTQMAFLGDGRILFSCFGVGGPGLGVFDPEDPDQPVRLFTAPAGEFRAITVDLEEEVEALGQLG